MAQISMCLELTATVEDRLSHLEAEVSRLSRLVISEQLYRQGQEFIKTEDITKSRLLGLSLLRESAGLGHGDAAFARGCYLEQGLICDGNQAESHYYFELAASLGNTSALATLGFRDGGDRVVLTDRPDALQNIKLSAHRRNALAQLAYGFLHCFGANAIEQDARAGFLSAKLAAEQRNPTGQFVYFACLAGGMGIEPNPQPAVECPRDLAAKGNAMAQYIYGFALSLGVGVAKNEGEALRCVQLSAEQKCPFGLNAYGTVLGNGYIAMANSVFWSHGFGFHLPG